nr:putative L-ascorbate peroxidase 6 [Tanacetum cinerariifolium]
MADTITMARAEAVSLCGGLTIPIRLGRLDLVVPDLEGKLPKETLDAFGLKQSEMTTMVGLPSDHALIEDEEKLDQSEEEHVRLEAALKKEFDDKRKENHREWQEKFKELQAWKITTPLPT